MTSKLTKFQEKTFAYNNVTLEGKSYNAKILIRYDDRCGNGHNTFSITAEITRVGNFRPDMMGCCHKEIAEIAPDMAKFIKWHHMNSDMPMHYIANTMYHASEVAPTSAFLYFTGVSGRELLDGLFEIEEAKQLAEKYQAKGFEVRIKESNTGVKSADLEAARSTAIWPDATLEQLLDKELLLARVPALVEEFKKDLHELGFVY